MTSLAFDTHSFVKRLTAAGFTQQQAEILAEEQVKLVGENLVTREHLDLRLAELRAELIKWIAGLLIAQGAVIVALVKLL